jgi:hypothetical protein
MHTIGKYLTELSMLDYGLLKYCHSEIAAAAVYIARKMTRQTPSWVSEMMKKNGQRVFSKSEKKTITNISLISHRMPR